MTIQTTSLFRVSELRRKYVREDRVLLMIVAGVGLSLSIPGPPARAQFCPMPAPYYWCSARQPFDCLPTGANETCLPLEVTFPSPTAPPNILRCDCLSGTGCGPVDIKPNLPPQPGYTVSCAGDCPPGQVCYVHLNGISQGVSSMDSSATVGKVVTCGCEAPPPLPVCPLGNSWCVALQSTDCNTTTTNETCLPREVTIDPLTGLPIILLCDCFTNVAGCGPVGVSPNPIPPGGYTVSCPGPCPGLQTCQLHFNGTPQGASSIDSSLIPPGTAVTCACAVQGPTLCPLPASAECAALQSRDCQSTTGQCLPKVIRHNVPAALGLFPPAGTDVLTPTTGYVVVQTPPPNPIIEYYYIRESPPNTTSVTRQSPVDLGGHRIIDTEIIAMGLVGVTGGGGGGAAIQIRESPTRMSKGRVTGAVSGVTDYPADSFFDLFVEIDIPGLGVAGLYNDQAIRLEAPSITAVPPLGSRFKTPQGWLGVELLDPHGFPTGYLIREVLHELPPADPPEWEVIQCACTDPSDCHVTRDLGVDPTCVGGCPQPPPTQLCTERITTGQNTVDYTCECAGPVRDHVVCEPQTGNNPTHPNTYWYDVTTSWVTCDFHVLVLDPTIANYTNGTIIPSPGNTWVFSVQQVGAETWATWRTPGCAEPIYAPTMHRFQFNHNGPSAWSHWRTTYSGILNPYDPNTVDVSQNHLAETDGYGYRVHVPTPPAAATQACCLPKGTCVDVEYNKCVALGGDPQGPGTTCMNPSVVCTPLKWAQPPTYGPFITQQPPCFWGWDEPSSALGPQFVADDWACSTNQPITDIHWWGSYQNWTTQSPPPIQPGFPDLFQIGIWEDVPAGVDRPFSHPGKMIWELRVPRQPGINERWVGCDQYPGQPGDTCFRYDFTIPTKAQWFYQKPSADPTIYWISIAAIYAQPTQYPWGWKTREHFFNDDAVRMVWTPMPPPRPPMVGDQFTDGTPIENPAGTSWDMAFVLTSASPGASKWDQWPNPDLPGLHAHDGITLADNWECQGGKVTDFHWWGNYELDAQGGERRGAGIQCINLSIHKNRPDVPWCLPQDPAEWGVCAVFDALHERDTGLVNSEGSKIYLYDFYWSGFDQILGQVYWLNIEAQSVNALNPALWRWQENSRDAAPRLCPAAERTPSQAWHTIVWGMPPFQYSEMAFRVTSTPYPPGPDPSATAGKNRYLSMVVPPAPAPPEPLTALRVTMLDLQNPQPPNAPCCPPKDFSAYEYGATCTDPGGCLRWVGKPGTFLESQDTPALGNYRAARLQCTPYYHDWGSEGVFHVTGAEIVPSSTYEVVSFALGCLGNEDTCADVSPPLRIQTARWGDIEAPYSPPIPGQPNAIDVAQMVNKFKNLMGAPVKVRAQLQPNLPEMNGDISALDISAVVDGVKGFAYPFSGPCPCPSAVVCGATACPAGVATCIAAYGAGAMCVKTCGGGANDGQPCVDNNPVHNHCPGGTCGNPLCRDRCGRCSP